MANLGDVQRGLASVITRMNAGRLNVDTGKAMIAGLKTLGDLYTGRLERKLDAPKKDNPAQETANISDLSTAELLEIARSETPGTH